MFQNVVEFAGVALPGWSSDERNLSFRRARVQKQFSSSKYRSPLGDRFVVR